jgi:hypothetical protein
VFFFGVPAICPPPVFFNIPFIAPSALTPAAFAFCTCCINVGFPAVSLRICIPNPIPPPDEPHPDPGVGVSSLKLLNGLLPLLNTPDALSGLIAKALCGICAPIDEALSISSASASACSAICLLTASACMEARRLCCVIFAVALLTYDAGESDEVPQVRDCTRYRVSGREAGIRTSTTL